MPRPGHAIGVVLAILLLASTAASQSRGPLDLANAPVPPGAQRIPYGTDPLQFGELRLPATKGPHPVAVVVHGGCWLAKLGTLDDRAVAIDNMRPVAAALTGAGIATWNIEYRRLGNAGGGWPGTFEDVGRAADFLRTLASQHQLDLTRVIAIGHSAGGHLAMWLGGRAKIRMGSELFVKEPLPLKGVVNLDGPSDLKATVAVQEKICGVPVITNLMGGAPETQPDRYSAGSPIELLPIRVPQVFFAGRMFGAQAAPHEAAARKAGDTVQTTVLPDAGHFVFIDPNSDVWPQVLAAAQKLVSSER